MTFLETATIQEAEGMGSKIATNNRSKNKLPSRLAYEYTIVPIVMGGKSFDSWVCGVAPYPFTFTAHAKRRWVGRTVLDIYENEFGAYPRSYFESAIQQGRIMVSGKIVESTYQVKDGDILSHAVHRHEPFVAVNSCSGIDVIAETDDLVIVDKPGTLPVHPCGAYSQNSLLSLLERKYGKLYNVNRLDRLTSGLVMLAKSSKVAQQMGTTIRTRESCQKYYLARVKGKFPMNCDTDLELADRGGVLPQSGEWLNDMSLPIQSNKVLPVEEMIERNALGYWISDHVGSIHRHGTVGDLFECQRSNMDLLNPLDYPIERDERQPSCSSLWLHLACPVRVADPKYGICEGGSFLDLDREVYKNTVKPAQTAFAVVRYDDTTDSTLVLCRPMTGRSHQIRLHLKFLGHPIVNDFMYGGDLWYADKDGEFTCHEARAKLLVWDQNSPTDDTRVTESEVDRLTKCQQRADETTSDFIQRTCFLCSREGGSERSMLEFLVKSRGIWLHAFQYTLIDSTGATISHRTKLPNWC